MRSRAVRVTIEQRTLRFRSPLQTSYGAIDGARSSSSSSTGRTASAAAARRRRWRPTTASRPRARAPRSRPTARSSRPATTRCRAASCSTPAAPPTSCRRRWPPSTWRCGTAPGAAPGCPVARLLTDDVLDEVRGQRDDRRRPIARAPPPSADGGAPGRLSLREAQGRHRRRRRPRRRGARGARARSRCCAWTPTAPGTSSRRVRDDRGARGGRPRARRGAGPRAARAARAARARRGADRDGRDGRRAGRAGLRRGGRGLPQDRALRRDLGAAGLRDARARVGRRALRRVDVRRAAGDRRGAARRRRAADRRRLRPVDARPLRRLRAQRSPSATARSRCRAGRGCWDDAPALRIAGAALRRPPGRQHYGEHPRQVADLHTPRGAGAHPVVVVLHGGYWQPPYTRLVMRPLCLDLVRRGYAALQRRVPPARPRRRRLAADLPGRRGGDRPPRHAARTPRWTSTA